MSTHQSHFKRNLRLIVWGSVIIFTGLAIIITLNILKIKNLESNITNTSQLLSKLEKIQSSVNFFLLHAWSDTTFVKQGNSDDLNNYYALYSEVETLGQEVLAQEESEATSLFKKEIESLNTNVSQLSSLIKSRGFKNLGLEGNMRRAAHQLENSEYLQDKSAILSLRKHEKDFFLRKDVAYLQKFSSGINTLNDQLSKLPESQRLVLMIFLQEYNDSFFKAVEIEKQIGLTKQEGLRALINQNIANASGCLVKHQSELKASSQYNYTATIAFVLTTLMVILGVILWGISRYIKPVFDPMEEIQAKANAISDGNLSVSFDHLANNKVLSELIGSLDKIVKKFRLTMIQVENISNRTLTEPIQVHSPEDEVGSTLKNIHLKSSELYHSELRRNWHNKGMADFAQLLRSQKASGRIDFHVVISQLVTYLKSYQGAFYVLKEQDMTAVMELKGCYAFNCDEISDVKILRGEGIVGACWSTRESIQLNHLPNNFVKISSGLGNAEATHLVVIPMIYNDKVEGVMEIASFKKIEQYEMDFLNAVAEILAAEINVQKISERNQLIVEHSQLLSVELQEQQEEMKQNMEELRATQEALDSKKSA